MSFELVKSNTDIVLTSFRMTESQVVVRNLTWFQNERVIFFRSTTVFLRNNCFISFCV